ncbi:hypothetical protein JKP88DRAFT_12314 [Tribonema minus]|uniref:ZC3H15/TMA46 family C-terminal domain-containing protein n=1 Tax=Tribonema minus TaxID=303371 RepID=A0A835ZLI2_9STRA|nr:hypothetical protein JKP88DRAFT_12314 [Tribonema minus]
MPPKKVDKKKIAKVIEDKTFGLKNKSKSKAVQQYVATVEKNVKNSAGAAQAEANKAKRKAAKEAAKQAELEMKALFNEALVAGKKAPKAGGGKGAEPDPVAVDTREKQVQETFVVAEETEKTIEDLIEEQRAKLAAEGKAGTPVTSETLAAWKARRAAARRDEERRMVEREMAKKGKKKGLAVLSGRALFDYDASLFKDDEDACGQEETSLREERGDSDAENADGNAAAAAATDAQVAALADGVDQDLFLEADDDDIELDDLDESDAVDDGGADGGAEETKGP